MLFDYYISRKLNYRLIIRLLFYVFCKQKLIPIFLWIDSIIIITILNLINELEYCLMDRINSYVTRLVYVNVLSYKLFRLLSCE
jgi:hypothetical protein